jgi:hypothetical protein
VLFSVDFNFYFLGAQACLSDEARSTDEVCSMAVKHAGLLSRHQFLGNKIAMGIKWEANPADQLPGGVLLEISLELRLFCVVLLQI